MKKIIWIGIGVLALGAVLFIGLKKVKQEEAGQATDLSNVPQVMESESSNLGLPRSDESRRDGGGTEQGRQDGGDTKGQAGMPAPQLSDAVKALIGEDGKEHNYSTLLAEINTLSYEIAPDDLT
ncbi:hypothetical protein P4C99_22215, partial [Pontiellaceae bacterium B1224]|nr:hypothetical protein [Pontiellaceae bacterium B1224]